MARLSVLPGEEEYQLSPAVSILNTLLRNGHQIMHQCGGKAQCGTCRIEIVSGAERLSPVRPAERERLGDEMLKAGRRLACQTFAFGDVTIRIPPAES